MARVIPHTRFRLEKSKRKFYPSKTQARRALGVTCAVFLYFLTGALVLFGAVALANADDGSARRVHAELTPSFGLSAGFSTQRAIEPSKLTEIKSNQKSDEARMESVMELDALQGEQSASTPEIERLKLEIAALASSLERSQRSAAKTTLSIAGAEATQDANKESEPQVYEQKLDKLDAELQDETKECAEAVEEEEEDSEPAFAYSNPSLRAPSMPDSVTPIFGLPQNYVTAPVGPAAANFQPVPYAAQVVLPAPTQKPTVPVAPQNYASQAQAPALPSTYVARQAQTQAPVQNYSIPAPAIKTSPAPQSIRTTTAINDNFHAKSDAFNGQLGGKTYRKLNEESLFGSDSAASARGYSSTKKTRSYGKARFSGAELKSGSAKIVQVSALVPVQSNEIVFATTVEDEEEYDDEEYEEEDYDDELLDEDYATEEEEEEEDVAETDETVEQPSRSDASVYAKPVRTSESAQDASASTPIRGKSSESALDSDDGPLFSGFRPFKRMRERRQLQNSDAPTPPSVEKLDPENSASVAMAKEPLLTRESANLPPLSVKTSSKYAENAEESAEEDEFVTKSELEATREQLKGFAWSKGSLKITPYGFLNLSVSSDSQRAVTGDYMLYAQSEDVDNSSGFTIDARTSRLGFKIEAGRVERLNADLGGTVEFDFQGYPNGSKNKGGVQFRRAFAELVDKQNDRRFLAGQDWEVISPGAPQMLNYLPAGFAGDLQYRRGQIRFEQGYTASSDLHFLTQIAACDNVLGDYTSTAGVRPASSGWPIIEGRVAAEMFKSTLDGKAVVVGLSGHIGEQYYKFSPIANVPMCSSGREHSVKTWSANVDFEAPLSEKHKIHGEYYHGSNLSSFIGGINQGVDLYTREGIGDQGGWLALHSAWTPKAVTNIGYGYDKPERDDLVGTSVASNGFTTARTKNEVFFTNYLYNWTANFMTGLEVSYWRTDYMRTDVSGAKPVFYDMKSGKDLRMEFTTRLSF